MSIRRAAGTTVAFIAVGAIAGAVTAVLSLSLIWLGLTQMPRGFASPWVVGFIAAVGVPCGAVVTPILGWLVIGRVGFWRAVFALTLAAVLGENLAAILFRSLNSDVLIVGAFLGALTGALVIRLATPPTRNTSSLLNQR